MSSPSLSSDRSGGSAFARRVAGIVLLVLLGLFVARAAQVLLLVFAACILALLLEAAASQLARRARVPHGVGFGVTLLLVATAVGVLAYLVGPDIASQADDMMRSLRSAIERLTSTLSRFEWGRRLLEDLGVSGFLQRGRVLSRIGSLFSTTLSVVTAAVAVVFLSIFLAARPDLYVRGLLTLVPDRHHGVARRTIGELAHGLRWWMLAKLVSATVSSLLAAAGLWLIGIPLVLTLTAIIFVASFIPYIGAVLSAIPAILIASTVGLKAAQWTTALYIGVQAIDAYVLSPIAEKRIASLPPALTLSVQLLLGVLVGALGVALAAPFVAAMMVLVRNFYVEAYLGRPDTGGGLGRSEGEAQGVAP